MPLGLLPFEYTISGALAQQHAPWEDSDVDLIYMAGFSPPNFGTAAAAAGTGLLSTRMDAEGGLLPLGGHIQPACSGSVITSPRS